MTDTHIKIKPVTPKVQYTGNGVTTVFPYEFPIFDETDMVVYVGDDIIESGYSVSGAGETDGGNVTFDTAPDNGVKITLLRNVPIERLTDFQEGGTFRPKNLNDEFDRQTAFVQQVQEKVDRTIILPPTSEIDPEQVLVEVERIYTSIDNVDAVADDLTNVNTVASNISKVQTTANNINKVNTVAGNISNVNTVASNSSSVISVAANESNINAVNANKTNINAVNSNKTNINAVASNSSNINTVATNISGVNTCASNMSAIQDAPNQAQAAANSAALAYQYGNDKINQTHISNCITYIPQDIKLELNNGTLTLRAGSKVYVPNGVGVFNTAITSSDFTRADTDNGKYFCYYKNNNIYITGSTKVFSGDTAPSGSGVMYWYDTSNNKAKRSSDGGSTWGDGYSLPFAVITVSNGAISSIDQVFNGFGYIGSTVFALPGVKGLIPNGRNADGTLKNTEFITSSVLSYTMPTGYTLVDCPVIISNTSLAFYNNYSYDESSNTIKPVGYCMIGIVNISSDRITSFTPKTVFHSADYSDVVKYSDKVMVDSWGIPDYSAGVSISSGYTAVSNGMVMIIRGGSSDSVSLYVDSVLVDGNYSNSSNEGGCLSAFVKKGSVVTWTTGNIADTPIFFPLIGG